MIVTDAVILMAGMGSRLGAIAKPLVRIGGRPLISYVFDALELAGVRTIHGVMGAKGAALAGELEPLAPTSMRFATIANPEWQKQNGVSVLCADGCVAAPFLLLMGDHLFEPALLETLLEQADPARVNLAIDRKITSIFDLDDATKVQTDGGRITAIGKNLSNYDAIDTGAFVCSAEIFDYLRRAQTNGDCSLSDGIRLMAAEGKVAAIDIGVSWWQDVDTPEMLARAEAESTRLLRDSRRGLPQEGVSRQERSSS